MKTKEIVEKRYSQQLMGFRESEEWKYLESGKASNDNYFRLIENICITHINSPQILAFLVSIAPPNSLDTVSHNMLEEMGLDEEGINHPSLLINLAESCGFSPDKINAIKDAANEKIKKKCSEAILFSTVKELGLATMLEVFSYEWMLSRQSSKIGDVLKKQLHLKDEHLSWFYHHSEVDIQHAEQAFGVIEEYLQYHKIEMDELKIFLDIVFKENVFINSYLEP